MNVTEAVDTRFSCRAFTDQAVPKAQLTRLLDKARRAPSGGNVQPWRLFALTGAPLKALVDEAAREGFAGGTEYAIYPEGLKEPHRSYRFKCGEDLYATIDIPREDKAGRFQQLGRNFTFFGAPVGLFLYLDRQMGPPQWSDAGMFLQTLMLLAREEGLDSCAQEAWAMQHEAVARHTGAPEEWMLFCGLALGHRDPAHPINTLRTDRAEVTDFTTFFGFTD